MTRRTSPIWRSAAGRSTSSAWGAVTTKAWQLDTKAWAYECAGWHRQTSVQAGTVMHGSKLPMTACFSAYLMADHSNGMSARQLWR
jgi:hypothetical protein